MRSVGLVVALACSLALLAYARVVTCADGMMSKAGPDACSQHGGVAERMK
jgi:hypothetical protein